jgi:hypothetical protein
MLLAKIHVIVWIALALSIPTVGQSKRQQKLKRKVPASNPSVYLSFIRVGKREPLHVNESDKGVWLRLHNNTRWSLVLNAYGAGGYVFATGKEDEVGMFYGVDEVQERNDLISVDARLNWGQPPPPGSDPDWKKRPDPVPPKIEEDCPAPSDDWCFHVCSSITLPPGKSLVFSVPRETLCKNLRIYLVFNYSWETRNGFVAQNMPEHRVYFYGKELLKLAH